MPRNPVDYSRTVIYKIVCNDLTITELYVGNTTQFTKRKAKHKCLVTNTNDKLYSFILYTTIRNNGGWENWTMVEVEKYPCTDSLEARAKERHWYDSLKAKLNTVKSYTSTEEKNVHYKLYRDAHKNKVKESNKNYREHNKSKLDEYEKSRKERKKEYNEAYYNRNFKLLRENRIKKCIEIKT